MYIELKPEEITSKLIELKGIYFVYYLLNAGEMVYIGCSKNIYKRFKEHKYQKQFDSIEMFSMPSQRQAKEKERGLISLHKPGQNGNAKHIERKPILNSDKETTTNIEQLKTIYSILNR